MYVYDKLSHSGTWTLEEQEIIHVKSWMALGDCNYEVDHADDSIPESGVVYCNIEHIHEFFKKCEKTDNKYVVISAFSDYGVALQEEHPVAIDMLKFLPFVEGEIAKIGYASLSIPPRCEIERCNIEDTYSVKCYSHTYSTFDKIPDNVVSWFTSNSMVRDDRIVSIPLGIHKDRPEDICSTISNQMKSNRSSRVNWVYANWQHNTIERYKLKESLLSLNADWITVVEEEKSYNDYITDLCEHSFAICPQGNGIDCYRMLECLYSGCIPIIKDEITYDYMKDLPHVKVNSWNEITPDFLKSHIKKLDMSDFNFNKIKLEYWKQQINEAKNLLRKNG